MRRYLVINFSALVIYILYPMAPPWLASKEGYIHEHNPRLTGRGWEDLGLGGFHILLAKVGNPVAAMPSLHGGLAMLVALYAITRLRSPWRWLLVAYPLLMGVALVYAGEHYVIDILAGWLLAAVVMAGCGWWERTHPRPAALRT
jgi:membrane-associated phospholipid phosphatase